MPYFLKPCSRVKGLLNLPGDKSISHRAVILSSIAIGNTLINNFSFSDDCNTTLNALEAFGIKISKKSRNCILINGVGLFGLKEPRDAVNLNESGTSIRILAGLLSAQQFYSKLDGDVSLRKRPMKRVVEPLKLMGANIGVVEKGKDQYPPLEIYPARLNNIKYYMSIPSAQVKSAILLAALYARGETIICEPVVSRDHTERMLKYFKADIRKIGRNIHIKPSNLISQGSINIPTDISSAAFFMVLATLSKNSCVKIKNVSLNPTRAGVVGVLKMMGADIKVVNRREKYFEPMADIVIKSSKLKAVTLEGKIIPKVIDELPILMVAASLAKGRSVFKGVEELRVKETDRIRSMKTNLSSMGARISTQLKSNKEVIIIDGVKSLKGSTLRSFGDHRTAMSMIVAALCASSPSRLDDIKCISKSFPSFLSVVNNIIY